MKKFFALIIAFFMLFAFVGCDNSTEFDFELRFNKIFEDVDVDNVTSDLKLPTSIGSLTIVWESSNTDVLSNDGKIFNTTGEVISVTLTAHMQHEKEKADLSKDLKIAPTGGIKDILEGETGTYKIKGTVVAINARSFIISDETNGILVFKGGSWACDVEIGEVLELRGETTKYPTSLTEGVGVQFGQDAVYTRVSTGTYTYPAAKELKAADVENYAKEKIIKPEYVKLTGKLSVSDKGDGKVYYNLVIDGTKIKGSLAYPTNSEELKALDGKNVEVYGYIVYGTGSTSVNFLNIVSTEVKEVGGGSVVEPEPETKKISDILAAEDGSYTAEGTVIATYARGFLIDDTTGKILVFLGQEFDGSIKVGDTVKVQGSTSLYGLMKQFGLGTTVEKTGEGAVDQPTATEIDGAKLDEYANATEAKVEYITFTGTLAAPDRYYNVTVEGASNVIGSITYPLNADEIKALNGKTVTVTGYLTGIASSNKYANVIAVEVKEVGGSVIEPEPEPITGDVVLDFVKNFGTYAGSWSTSYEPKTITGKDLGLNNNIKVVISIANKQKDDQPIADRPVIAVGKKGIEQTVVVSGFEGKLKDVTFNLKQWNEKKKFDSIIIEYSEDGTTWTKASDDAISGGSSAIATNQEVKSNVDLSTAKYIRLYIKADSSSNQQLGLTSISLNFEK